MGRTVVRSTHVVRSSSSSSGDRTWIVAVIFACIALLFVILAVALPGWNGRHLLKNCTSTCLSTTVLSFIAMFLIFLGIIATILFALRLITSFSSAINTSAVILLTLAGIFIVAAYVSYNRHDPNHYSYYLMVTAGIFTFVSSILTAFWLGRNWHSV
ncbi:unnamed protein product [Adineta ricciae]|uniref:Uncharacterized protein n=1 Tax=Adineta ricciae TaxID=249248 RepID=A0A815H819_ADIRI|nr:unnamed protein product [Adineta ricciae]CAF1348765.1 unnamed protein product [Adineta ricciae]